MGNGATINIQGMKSLSDVFSRLKAKVPAVAADEISYGLFEIQRIAKHEVAQHGTGKVYQLYRPRREHQASAPYAPPSTDLGMLMSRIDGADAIQVDKGKLIGTFGPRNYPIASYLEFGTSAMAPRPFLFPAFNQALPTIIRNMSRALADAAEQR